MADDIKVKATAKTVENKKQDEELESLKKAKADAAKKAEEEKEKNKKKKEEAEKAKAEAKKKEEENAELTNTLISGASALAGAALSSKKGGGFFKGLIIGIIIGAILMGVVTATLGGSLLDTVDSAKDTADEILDDAFLGYTAADFKDAILGKAEAQQKMIIMEQYLSIETTITKSGLGGLEIFSKTKNITFSGTGYYVVDLQYIDADHIAVDEEKKVVTVTIPHAVVDHVEINYNDMRFEDTEKGLLAFGDISLTTEQQNDLYASVENVMLERLNQKDLLNQADEFAKMKTWQTFQPLISAVSSEYTVEMVFAK